MKFIIFVESAKFKNMTNISKNKERKPPKSSQKIDPMQLELLEMFSSRKMTQQELRDIKLLIANYYAQKADEALDQLFEEKGWDVQEKVKEWGQRHDRIQGGHSKDKE